MEPAIPTSYRTTRHAWRQAKDSRLFPNAVFWILRTGAPWRDSPPGYGDWKNTHRRFCRWRDKGIWESLSSRIIDAPDFGWVMIDRFRGERLLADSAYDAQGILGKAKSRDMKVAVRPRKNRKEQREYDRHLCKIRRLAENAFLHLKCWRGMATRHARNTRSFIAAVRIRRMTPWTEIL